MGFLKCGIMCKMLGILLWWLKICYRNCSLRIVSCASVRSLLLMLLLLFLCCFYCIFLLIVWLRMLLLLWSMLGRIYRCYLMIFLIWSRWRRVREISSWFVFWDKLLFLWVVLVGIMICNWIMFWIYFICCLLSILWCDN